MSQPVVEKHYIGQHTPYIYIATDIIMIIYLLWPQRSPSNSQVLKANNHDNGLNKTSDAVEVLKVFKICGPKYDFKYVKENLYSSNGSQRL